MLRANGRLASSADEIRRTDGAGDATVRSMLVGRAQQGDRGAFESLVDRWQVASFRTAYAILGDEADARDATQDSFLRAWRELPRLRDPARFDAWFERILVNRCRTLLKGRARTRVREIHLSVLPEGRAPSVAHDPGPSADIPMDALERAFDRLSARDRTLLVLHHLEHHPVAEIASRLGVPVGTAKSRLFAARQALGRALEVELR